MKKGEKGTGFALKQVLGCRVFTQSAYSLYKKNRLETLRATKTALTGVKTNIDRKQF